MQEREVIAASGHPPRTMPYFTAIHRVPCRTLFMPSVTVWTFRLTYCTPSALVNSKPCRSPRHHEVQYDSWIPLRMRRPLFSWSYRLKLWQPQYVGRHERKMFSSKSATTRPLLSLMETWSRISFFMTDRSPIVPSFRSPANMVNFWRRYDVIDPVAARCMDVIGLIL